jgi:hypothetical protein
MKSKLEHLVILISVGILSFTSTSGQCGSPGAEIEIPPIIGKPIKVPRSLKSPNGEYLAILKSVEGGALKLFVKTSPTKILDPGIEDVNGIQWLPDGNTLIFTVSPIYGKPGIYTWNVRDNIIKQILKPKNFDKFAPDGKDFFEMLSLSEDGKNLFFFYSPEVEKTDFWKFRSKENLYTINIDGTGFEKISDRN